MEIINNKLEIVNRYFRIGEDTRHQYTIIGTVLHSEKWDVVINIISGKRKSFSREDLKRFLDKNNAVGYKRL